MTNEGIETLLALERHKVKSISAEEVEELLEFFCGKEEEDENRKDSPRTEDVKAGE